MGFNGIKYSEQTSQSAQNYIGTDPILDRYQHKYGQVIIDLDAIVPEPEQEHQAPVEFTIRKASSYITRYYGTATLQAGQVHFDVYLKRQTTQPLVQGAH